MRVFEGNLRGEGLSIAIVLSRFNEQITSKLLEGAVNAIKKTGIVEETVEVWKVPGSFELSLIASKLAASEKYDAIICLGAIIRGETPHFDLVASEVAKGIAQTSLQHGIPVAFGVVTADNMEQAIDRAGGKMGNRGFDAALSAIEMANLLRTSGL